jgi:hypothetical protein
MPRRFELTRSGRDILKSSVIDALENSRERDRRFDLALAGLPAVNKKLARDALKKRQDMLLGSARVIMEKYNHQGGDRLPFHARAVFRHTLFQIEQELNFTRSVIDEMG